MDLAGEVTWRDRTLRELRPVPATAAQPRQFRKSATMRNYLATTLQLGRNCRATMNDGLSATAAAPCLRQGVPVAHPKGKSKKSTPQQVPRVGYPDSVTQLGDKGFGSLR